METQSLPIDTAELLIPRQVGSDPKLGLIEVYLQQQPALRGLKLPLDERVATDILEIRISTRQGDP
jgi:hypothetical protein